MPTGNEPTLDELKDKTIVAVMQLFSSKDVAESDKLYEEARYNLALLWLNRNMTTLKDELSRLEAKRMIILGAVLALIGVAGIFAISLCMAAKWADKQMEEFDYD